jgi:hypothetical protein
MGRSRGDVLEKLEQRPERRVVIRGRSCPGLRAHDVVDDGDVAQLGDAPEPLDGGRLSSKTVDDEGRVEADSGSTSLAPAVPILGAKVTNPIDDVPGRSSRAGCPFHAPAAAFKASSIRSRLSRSSRASAT